jgi:hypothetical protein
MRAPDVHAVWGFLTGCTTTQRRVVVHSSSGRRPRLRAATTRQEGAALAMDAGIADDVVSLALTLTLCAVLTVGGLLWGRAASPRR